MGRQGCSASAEESRVGQTESGLYQEAIDS